MNESMDAGVRWIPVGRFADIPVRGARRIVVGEGEAARTIAVFRTAADALHALEDKCPHKGGPLSQGIVHGDCVTCPLHNMVIGLGDGAARGADEGAVARYAVRREGDSVLLAPDAPLAAVPTPLDEPAARPAAPDGPTKAAVRSAA